MVVSDHPLVFSHLVVTLLESGNRKPADHSAIQGDGGFEFRRIPAGTYILQLAEPNGGAIEEKTVSLNGSDADVEIRVSSHRKRTPAGIMSARDSLHPVSAKSAQLFTEAQQASAAGQYFRAVQLLRGTLQDAAAVPWARMNIGVALLNAGQAAAAVTELDEAVGLLPDDAAAHTNLACALLLSKRPDAAEFEVRRALQLDPNNSKARCVKGAIMLDKGRADEGAEELRMASREIPKARVMLARFYLRNGQKNAALSELREFLPQASRTDRVTVERWLTTLAQ